MVVRITFNTTIGMEPELVQAVDAVAARERLSRSEFCRDLISNNREIKRELKRIAAGDSFSVGE
jgi:metal-responsive CopG/Arc/MetJ family transcriptional regulator